jgi:hypothetical protein
MSILKFFIAAAAFQLLQAQEINGPNYVNIEILGLPEGFLHPETPAGVNDSMCSGHLTSQVYPPKSVLKSEV